VGGLGSGWQRSKRATVEDSLSLSLPTLLRLRALLPGARASGSWCWTREGEDAPHAMIGYEASLVDRSAAWLRLNYRVNGDPVDDTIALAATIPHYGGLRWWFICPHGNHGIRARRRVMKLYLPPGRRYFRSREAHGLTYKSCQESTKDRSLFRLLSADLGIDEAVVRATLEEPG